MNNLFRGIPFSQEDKIHEYMCVRRVLCHRFQGGKTKEILLAVLNDFAGFRKRASGENLPYPGKGMTD